MILPTGAIHLLDRLKFRFHEDHGIDGRLTEAFMSSATALEAVGHVLSFLQSSLEPLTLFWWEKTTEASYRLVATSQGIDVSDAFLPERFLHVAPRRFIRFEAISADWQDSISLLYGTKRSDVGAIDVWKNETHLLLVAWGETPPNHAPDDPALSLLEAAAAIDDVPTSLKRVVRALNGKSYHLPALLALHRMHDEQTAIRQTNAIRLATGWLAKDDPERETIVAMIRIQDVGTILAPRFVLTKPKRSKGEIELIDETIDNTPDLLDVFTLPFSLMEALRFETQPQAGPLTYAASIALSAWRLADAGVLAHLGKIHGPLAKRMDPHARTLLKANHRV